MKHIKHFKIFTLLMLLVSLVTISCSNLYDTLTDVKITYNSVLGEAPTTKYVKANYILTEADLPRLVQKGYSFKDWYIGDKPIVPGYVITDDTILKGKWDSNKYKIKFDANGGDGSLESIEDCEFSYKVKLPPVQGQISRYGYYFVGWTTTKDGSGKLYPDGIEVMNLTAENNGVVTLYAKWSEVAPNMATVYYASQLGTKPSSIQKFVGTPISDSELPVLEANGYEFLGWYYGPDEITNGYPINQDIVLTAKWSKIGTVASVDINKSGKVDIGEEVELSCATEGADIYYTINGETSSRKQYKKTEPIIITEDINTIEAIAYKKGMKVSDVSSARYSIKKYHVTFNSYGSKEVIQDIPDLKKGDIVKFSDLPSIKRENHDFLGWFLNGKKIEDDITIDGNIVLVAQWQQFNKVSNVMFSKNSESDIMVDVGDKIELSCPTVGADIYYTTNGTTPTKSSTKYDSKNPIVINENTEIKAIATKTGLEDSEVISNTFKIKTYHVIFNSNGGKEKYDNWPDLKKGNTIEKTSLPTTVTKKDCIFLGWAHNGKLITEEEPLLIQGNTILVAQWQEIGKTANVMFSKLNDSVDYGDIISLSCPTNGAEIFYTIDSEPEKKYDNATKIKISKGCTISAYAKAPNLLKSETLSSKYTLKTYTVTLNGNGIDNPLYTKSFKKNDTLLISELPDISTKYADHKFLGWYHDGTQIKDSIKISGNITLVAQWEAISKTDNVIFSRLNEAVDNGEVITLTCPTEGAEIYYTIDSGLEQKYNKAEKITISKECTITAYAKAPNLLKSKPTSSRYTIKTYTVTLNGNGVANPSYTKSFKKDDVLLISDLPDISDKYTNHTFLGWYLDGKQVIDSTNITGNITLVAQWQEIGKTANVIFSRLNEPVDKDEVITLSCPTSGAEIFYTIDSGSEQKYDNATKIKISKECTISAYAKAPNLLKSETTSSKYTHKTYSVTLNGNGVPNPSYDTNYKNGETLLISDLPDISTKYDGHKFLGWYHNGTKITNSITISGNITLVANWELIDKVSDVLIYPKTNSTSRINEVDYYTQVTLSCTTVGATIHYTTDGNTPTKDSPTYTENTALRIEDTSKNTVIKAIAVKEGLSDSNVTSSTYKVKTYTVSVYTNEADDIDRVITGTNFKKEDTIGINKSFYDSLKNLKKANYIFDGFYDSEGTKVENLSGFVVKENTSLFAKWNQEVVTIDSVTGLDKIDGTTIIGSGAVDKGDKIYITAKPSDALIYYTLDTKDVPDTWIKYNPEQGITLPQRDDFVLRFHASKKGLQESNTITMNYKVKKYEVTFSSNETYGTIPPKLTNLYKGDVLTEENLAITPKEEKKYKFIAWKNGDEVVKAGHVITKSLSLVAEWKEIVSDVVFSVLGGEVEADTQIELSCTTTGAKIYYTTDGTTPTIKSTVYEKPIVLKEDATISAIAIKENAIDSKITKEVYTIKKVTPVVLYISLSSYNANAAMVQVNIDSVKIGDILATKTIGKTFEGEPPATIQLFKFELNDGPIDAPITVDYSYTIPMTENVIKEQVFVTDDKNKPITVSSIFKDNVSKVAVFECGVNLIEVKQQIVGIVPLIGVSYEEPSGSIIQVTEYVYNNNDGTFGDWVNPTYYLLSNNAVIDVKEDTQYTINFLNMEGQPIDAEFSSTSEAFKKDESGTSPGFIGMSAISNTFGNPIVNANFTRSAGSPLSVSLKTVYKRVEIILEHPQTVSLADASSMVVTDSFIWIKDVTSEYSYEPMGNFIRSNGNTTESATQFVYYYYLKDADFPKTPVQYQVTPKLDYSTSLYQVKDASVNIDDSIDINTCIPTYEITPENKKVVLTLPNSLGAKTNVISINGNNKEGQITSDSYKWSSVK